MIFFNKKALPKVNFYHKKVWTRPTKRTSRDTGSGKQSNHSGFVENEITNIDTGIGRQSQNKYPTELVWTR